MPSQLKITTLRLSKELNERLASYVARKGATISKVGAIAIARFLDEEERKEEHCRTS